MIPYLGSLVQFIPDAGRAGRCRQISLCVDSAHRVLATLGLPRTGVSVLSPSTLLRLPAALYGAGPALSAVPVFRSFHNSADSIAPAFCVFPGLSGSGSQGLGRTVPGCGVPFPSAAPARTAGWVPVAWFVLRSWPLATTLPAADVHHPVSQEVFR